MQEDPIAKAEREFYKIIKEVNHFTDYENVSRYDVTSVNSYPSH